MPEQWYPPKYAKPITTTNNEDAIDSSKWNLRPDGTKKGKGYLGVFKTPTGEAMSEYSIADSEKLKDKKGNYIDYPTLVPELTKDELNILINHKEGESIPQSIKDKAEAHALKRKEKGEPLFATEGEQNESLYPEITRSKVADGKWHPPEYASPIRHPATSEEFTPKHKGFLESLDPIRDLSTAGRSFANSLVGFGEALIGGTGDIASDFEDRKAPKQELSKADIARRIAGFTGLEIPTSMNPDEWAGAIGGSMPGIALGASAAHGLVRGRVEPTIQEPPIPEQKLLGPGPINLPEGITRDVPDTLPLRRSREIPYQSPESYSTAELGRPRAKLYDPEAEYANYIKKMANEDMDASVKLRGTPRDIPDNPKALELERLRTGRSVPANLSVQDVMKPESLSMMDRMHAENAPIFRQMQESGMFSRNDLPIRNPQAMFKYMQPDELGNQMPMYDVQGTPGINNPSGGSDLSFQSLGERGIDLAEGPLPANRVPPIRRTLSPFGEAEGTKAISPLGQRLLSEEGSAKIIEDKKPLPPSKGPAGPAVDKLLNNIQQSKGIRTKQEGLYKQERARRFAAFEGVSEGGVSGAKQSLGKLKGEYDKINRTGLDMSPEETDSLFNAVKGSYLTTPEKARAYSTLFKILEGGGVPQRNELKLLDDVFSDGFAEKFIEMHGGLGATGIKIGKTANTMKSLMSSADLSAPLRQGIGLIHRPEWRDSFKEMFKYLTNKDYFDNAMLALHNRPNYQLGREAGLFLSKLGNLLSGEEAFMNSYVHNLPGIKNIVGASERAYTGFLNKLRADTFDNLVKNAEAAGHKVFDVVDGRKVPTQIANNLAKFVNNATGRGSLGTLEKFGPELNNILWSPRLISSRLTVLNPKYYMDLDPFTRKEAIKSLLAIASASTTMNTIASLAGAKVGYNILSSDFAKSRFGNNKVLDPNAGFQQPIVAASRMIVEANRMRQGKKKVYNAPNIPEIAGRFMVNKLAPATGLAYDVATAKAFTGGGKFTDRFGNKKSIQAETLKRFVPIFAQDLQQLIQSDPSFAESVGLGGAALFGAGVQDYPERSNQTVPRKMGLSF